MIAYGDCYTAAVYLAPDGAFEFSFEDGSSVPSARHNGGANLLFCDGHVECDRQAHWIERTDQARRRWNIDGEPHPETWK